MNRIHPLQQLTDDLKVSQHALDRRANQRLANIKSHVKSLRDDVGWLKAHKNRIARPPHSFLSDYTDSGLSRFGDQLVEQGRLLSAVGESLKSDLLHTFGEPLAIKKLKEP
jgi:hypothetical protein